MNFELVKSEYFDADAIRLPDYQVGRVSYGNGRSYIRLKDGELENPFRLYTSLTTAINTCAPMNQGLLEWNVKLGLQEAARQLKLSQHYGTLMHILFGKFLMEKHIDLDSIADLVEGYTSSKNYWQPECADWANKLKYDCLAFAHFCNEYKVKPLGIEYVLLSEKYGFGTLIDLVCKLTIQEKGFWGEVYKSGENKDKPKETKKEVEKIAIINFKSGRHGFYPNNGIQAIAEKLLWEENFPDLKLDCAFNWAPKEWIMFPDFSLKDWTGEVEVAEVEAIMQLAKLRFAEKAMNKKYISLFGFAIMGKGVENNISSIGVEEFCQRNFTDLMVEAK